MGDEIEIHYGVTQGRHSSSNIYSFYVSDMPSCTDDLPNSDFMDPYNEAQLADDTVIFAETFTSIIQKFRCIFDYSKRLYQVSNIDKTVYCHFADNPIVEPIEINDVTLIKGVKSEKGVKFYPTNDFDIL